jgi:hypothetical protein
MAHMDTAGDLGLHTVAITDQVERRSRLIARIWSAVAIVVFVVLAATVGFPHGPELETWEVQVQLGALGLIIFATLLAWRWEGIGGSLLLVGATTLGVLAALQHQPLVAFLPAAAFIVPAMAFLVAWHRTRTFAAVIVLATTLTMVLVAGSLTAQAFYDYGYGATHPSSTLPDLPEDPVLWMWSGGVTHSDAVVVGRVDTSGDVRLLLSSPGGESTHSGAAADDGTWRFALSGLDPDTPYTYRFLVGGTESSRTGSFHTLSAGPQSFRVAVGSCSRLGSNGSVYEAILATDPDLMLFPGDFFYADHVQDFASFSDAYDTTLTEPAQAALYAAVPVAYVWDDHDFGGNDSDSTDPIRPVAQRAYRTFVPHYPLTGPETINQAFAIGRVRFLLLDTRSARDPKSTADGPGKTMLGPAQLAWLEEQLLEAQEQDAVTVIVSSVPWITAADPGADDWGGYSAERQVIADFIAEHQLDERLFMVAGDAHMVAIDNGIHTNYSAAGDTTFPLLHAAALDRPGSVKGGPYSEGVYPGGGQFGLIEVTDDGGDLVEITLSGHDWTGAVLVEYTFSVAVPEVV